MQIHVVDDDSAIGQTIARSVAREGWQAVLHSSANDFLAEVASSETGCILCDIKMPGMSGLELLEVLNDKYADWPVIMMTGYGSTSAAVEAFRNGAIHFLQKPFRRAELLDTIEEAAEEARRRSAETARKRQANSLGKLSPRESEILAKLAEGMQSKVVAHELGISVRTVEMHRSSILKKLAARNTSDAVALLLQARA